MRSLKITALLMLTCCLSFHAGAPEDTSDKVQWIADQNRLSAFSFYRNIAQGESGNVFFSPFSISTALAMTYAGARRNTAEEMSKALSFAPGSPEFHEAYGLYTQALIPGSADSVQFRVANRLWAERDYEFLEEFLSLLSEAYESDVERLDFRRDPEAGRLRINDWVAAQTEQKILNLLPYGSVDNDTRLVLSNAIYFKGDWKHAFDEALTQKRAFFPEGGGKSMHDFMQQRNHFQYMERDSSQWIRLPYEGGKHSLVIAMPYEGYGIERFGESLEASALDGIYKARHHEVKLAMPSFELTQSLSLKKVLQKMGMRESFSERANFSGMSSRADLAISDVIHKAFVEVNEKGTEAAAATAVIMMQTSSVQVQKPKIKYFTANRPFLFFIMDDSTRSVLFMGRMSDPALSA